MSQDRCENKTELGPLKTDNRTLYESAGHDAPTGEDVELQPSPAAAYATMPDY